MVTAEEIKAHYEADGWPESRIRSVYPAAVWMPWDDPPIGMTVTSDVGLTKPSLWDTGKVIGRNCDLYPKGPEHANVCPCCKCPPPELTSLDSWWVVESLHFRKDGMGYSLTGTGEPMRVLWYPPSCSSVEEPQ